MQDEFKKNEAIEKMTDNLKILRNKLNLTQEELAGKIGTSRQTIISIENKKRAMTWIIFMALVTVFKAEHETNVLLNYFGIYTAKLNKYLTSPENIFF